MSNGQQDRPKAILIDTGVIIEIDKGNIPAAKLLLKLQKGASVYIGYLSHYELVILPANPLTRTSNQKLLDKLNLKRHPSTKMANRFKLHDINFNDTKTDLKRDVPFRPLFNLGKKSRKSNPKRAQIKLGDIHLVVEAGVIGAEIYTFDSDLRGKDNSPQSRKLKLKNLKKLNTSIVPECFNVERLPGMGQGKGLEVVNNLLLSREFMNPRNKQPFIKGFNDKSFSSSKPSPISRTRIVGASASALALALEGINWGINKYVENREKKRAEKAFKQKLPMINRIQHENLDEGVLLIFHFRGPIFVRIGTSRGIDEYTAKLNYSSTLTEGGYQASYTWYAALKAPKFKNIPTPFSKGSLARFVKGRGYFQKTQFKILGGFDDYGREKVYLLPFTPTFFVLHTPEKIQYWNGYSAVERKIDRVTKKSANGEYMIAFDIGDNGAVMIFPADKETAELFEQARSVSDRANALKFYNFRLVRWVEPALIYLTK